MKQTIEEAYKKVHVVEESYQAENALKECLVALDKYRGQVANDGKSGYAEDTIDRFKALVRPKTQKTSYKQHPADTESGPHNLDL